MTGLTHCTNCERNIRFYEGKCPLCGNTSKKINLFPNKDIEVLLPSGKWQKVGAIVGSDFMAIEINAIQDVRIVKQEETVPSPSHVESSGHFIKKCSCGRVIAQCRCISQNKRVEVVKNGCMVCQSERKA